MSRRRQWRCFYCDEVFRSEKLARIHFGVPFSFETPACKLSSAEGSLVAYIRRLEAEINEYRNESHETLSAAYVLHSTTSALIPKAKEEGYNQGVAETIDMVRSMGFDPYNDSWKPSSECPCSTKVLLLHKRLGVIEGTRFDCPIETDDGVRYEYGFQSPVDEEHWILPIDVTHFRVHPGGPEVPNAEA